MEGDIRSDTSECSESSENAKPIANGTPNKKVSTPSKSPKAKPKTS